MKAVDVYRELTGFPLDKVVVFDTETTGTDPYYDDEILSIAICDAMGETLFSSHIKPTRKKSWPEAQAVNGISPEMVKDAPTIGEAAPRIRECLLGNKLVVGYNVSFDLRFLAESGVLEDWPPALFDVMREYAKCHGTKRNDYNGGYRYSKLVDCARSFGYSFDAHDAMEDARATAHCFRALVCDDAYIRGEMKQKIGFMSSFHVSQTKATSATILKMVEGGTTSNVKAELRLGEVTRGKTKGSPRYECYIGDECVGVGSPDQVDDVRRFFAIGDGDGLPKSIAAKALLSASGENGRCAVTVTERPRVLEAMIAEAATEREKSGFGYREVKPMAQERSKVKIAGDDRGSDYSDVKNKTAAAVFIVVASLLFLSLMLFFKAFS